MTVNPFPEGDGWAHNVELVGYADLDGRPAFKLALLERDGRWLLYVAHLWHRGWSILDVTDPARPEHLRFIEGPDNTWTIQLQIADGKLITALERIASGWGRDENRAHEAGLYIWDLSDPVDPRRIGQYRVEGKGTHRNYYDGGRYVHLAAGLDGYAGNIYVILDIEDPTAPKEAGRWWLPGQWTVGGEAGAPRYTSLHGGAYVEGDRAYLPYGGAGVVTLDIADVTRPRPVDIFAVSPPFTGLIGVHSAIPLPNRNLICANSESVRENCEEPLSFCGLIDISDETAPRLVSTFPWPAPPPGAPFRNFCEYGGRFGPHNQHQGQHQTALTNRDDLIYMTWFNAGLRIFDISDARLVREVGYFVPPPPKHRHGPLPRTLVAQSEDVIVDARGNIYMSDKNQGIYIMRQSGGRG